MLHDKTLLRTSCKQMLTSDFKQLGIIKIKFLTSIAAARDWHRHRTGMPWSFTLALKNDQPFIHSNFIIPEQWQQHTKKLLKKSFNLFNGKIESLYAFPYGTTLEITGFFTLPDLLYTLELRSKTIGANSEYKEAALKALLLLKETLGDEVSKLLII